MMNSPFGTMPMSNQPMGSVPMKQPMGAMPMQQPMGGVPMQQPMPMGNMPMQQPMGMGSMPMQPQMPMGNYGQQPMGGTDQFNTGMGMPQQNQQTPFGAQPGGTTFQTSAPQTQNKGEVNTLDLFS